MTRRLETIRKFGIEWQKRKSGQNTLYMVNDEELYDTCKKWFMLVQNKNNETIYLAYHMTDNPKKYIATNINTSQYVKGKQKLYEINDINSYINPNHKYNDYSDFFQDTNLFAIPDQYTNIVAEIDPLLGNYVTNDIKQRNLFSKSDNNTKYWWLSASQKNSFKFAKLKPGEEEFYTIKAENGNFRQKQNNYAEIKAGDKFVGYDGYPDAKLISTGEVIRKDEEKVYIKNTKIFTNPISLSSIQNQKEHEFRDCLTKAKNINYGSLFKITKEEYNYILNLGDKKMDDTQPTNQILYGPPGTGKTYNAVVEAIKILDKNLWDKYNEYINLKEKPTKENIDKGKYAIYEDLQERFDELKEDKRIEFITFHQSYSYEDFVEGIKPYIPKDIWEYNNDEFDDYANDLPDVKYIGKKGIFREICDRADKEIPFDELYKLFMKKYPEGSELKTVDKQEPFVITKYMDDGFEIDKGSDNKIRFDNLQELYNNHQVTPYTDRKSVEKDCTNKTSYYYSILLELDKLKKPYVLIIDEINRGNISKIFGELITLLEEDKRGKLKVKLPYSQDEFTVPDNLYIIGTMNTSDRSIASVDIALRRRFKFKEMMPNPKLLPEITIHGFDLKEDIFETLNKRISILLDRDHQIGHSYFMNVTNENDFKKVWFDCIIPLLNEYFYGDWEKLRALLGDAKDDGKSFIKKIKNVTFAYDYKPDDDDIYDFSSKDDLKDEKDFAEALKNAFKTEE